MAADVTNANGTSAPPGARIRPRDAATLVIIDQSEKEPRVLMGRRRPDQVFLPGAYVFPGGRVERSDHRMTPADALRDPDIDLLMQKVRGTPSPTRAQALALAAIRETFEETGILVGLPSSDLKRRQTGPWSTFLAHGFLPRVGGLRFFARAITPPGRPRRYDTRFFYTYASEIGHRVDTNDGEFSEIGWFTFADVANLNLPSITRTVVGDLATILNTKPEADAAKSVPFYFHRSGIFERRMLSQEAGSA